MKYIDERDAVKQLCRMAMLGKTHLPDGWFLAQRSRVSADDISPRIRIEFKRIYKHDDLSLPVSLSVQFTWESNAVRELKYDADYMDAI